MTLIQAILSSQTIHIFSLLNPPKVVIDKLHSLFAGFFWGDSEFSKRRHWRSWLAICCPKEEGGLGFRNLFDVAQSLH
ncbi:hypothetical protein PSY81_23635, partial [Shigella flexneri]|nr:hypothetical protein [Shigella flexneri]